MNILEITGEPIGTGGQEMFIINCTASYKYEGFEDRFADSVLFVRMRSIVKRW